MTKRISDIRDRVPGRYGSKMLSLDGHLSLVCLSFLSYPSIRLDSQREACTEPYALWLESVLGYFRYNTCIKYDSGCYLSDFSVWYMGYKVMGNTCAPTSFVWSSLGRKRRAEGIRNLARAEVSLLQKATVVPKIEYCVWRFLDSLPLMHNSAPLNWSSHWWIFAPALRYKNPSRKKRGLTSRQE